MADVQQPKKIPLSPLPLPYELLALAIRYAQAAYELSPYIARRPTQDGLVDMLAEWQEESDPEDVSQDTRKQRREDATEERADTIASYRRYIGMAIICLKRVVSLEGGGDVRLDLRARAMLAELLVRETKNTVEAESILTKGVSMFETLSGPICQADNPRLCTDCGGFARQYTFQPMIRLQLVC